MRFEDKIRCLGLLFDFSVVSWIRSRSSLAAHCPNNDRQHLLGLAVDIVLDIDEDVAHFYTYTTDLGLEVATFGGWLHVQEPRG
jgi:hypothetical protein